MNHFNDRRLLIWTQKKYIVDEFSINCQYVTDKGLSYLKDCKTLESLTLYCIKPSTKHTGHGIKFLSKLPKLTYLKIENMHIPNDTFQHIGKYFRALKTLNIVGSCKYLQWSGLQALMESSNSIENLIIPEEWELKTCLSIVLKTFPTVLIDIIVNLIIIK